MSPKKLYTDAPKYLVPLEDEHLNNCIQLARQQLDQHFTSLPQDNLPYLINDIDKVVNCDFEVRRYLFQTNLNVDQAVEMIKDRLTWRKEMSLDTLRYEKFPIEFYKSGGIFEFKADNDGDPVLYVRSKFNVNIEILSQPLRQFLIFFMDQMDQRFSRERSWGLVFDAQGFSWNNIDFDFLHLIIKILKYYMPWSVKYVIIYEIPWFLESIWKVAQHCIPEDGKRLIRVYNKKTIGETINPINIPKVIGGLSQENHILIPEGVKPATVIGKIELGLNDEDVNRIIKHLAKLDKEMYELIKA